MKHSILCVDDEIDNVEALERLFRKRYNVLTALSGKEALRVIQKERVSLIISDQRMPQMTGTEFFKQSINYVPEAIRILLTGFTDISSVISAINSGEVFRYVTKPWDPVDLTNTVDKAIERFELASELKEKNIALKKALEELKGLDKAKTHFMYLVNHELKTPLTVLSSFLELLNETQLNDEQQKYISKISSSNKKLQKIVEDVLQLSSAETGLLPIHPQPIQLKDILAQVIHEQADSVQSKSITFKIQGENMNIQADPKVLKKVLSHLINNAIKFGNSSSTVECGVRPCNTTSDDVNKEYGSPPNEAANKTANGTTSAAPIEIYISNSGKALENSVIENILKPFTLNEDIMKHSKGLGLGLSLCQALLKRHGSELKIHCLNEKVDVSFQLSS